MKLIREVEFEESSDSVNEAEDTGESADPEAAGEDEPAADSEEN